MKRHNLTSIFLASLTALSFACVEQADDPAESFRTLPVAALTTDGDEVLVGTYDEATGELALTPAFVAAIESEGERETTMELDLEIHGPGQVVALASRSQWSEPLAVGTELWLATTYQGVTFTGGTLVIEAPDWTDSLSESEAATAFPDCFDVIDNCKFCPSLPPEESL